MRNLSLYALSVTKLTNGKLSATAVDIDENVLYAATESKNPGGDVDVELWKLPLSQKDEPDVSRIPGYRFAVNME